MRSITRLAGVMLVAGILLSPCSSLAEKPTRGVVVTPPQVVAGSLPITGDYWALIIGIDQYQHAPKLESAVMDAKGVREVLIQRYGFKKDRVIDLLNEQATRTNIEDALYQLGRQAGVNDSILVYYAGHGQFDEEGHLGWWVPVEAYPERPGTFITNASVRDYLNGMKARHVYLVADSCFSGTLFGTRALPPASKQWYDRLYSKRSRWGLTSGGTEPVADRGRSGHSLFAYHFIQILKENSSPYLVPSHIFDQLAPIIANNSDQTPRSEPIKGAGDEGGQFVFVLDGAHSDVAAEPPSNLKTVPTSTSSADRVSKSTDGLWVVTEGTAPLPEGATQELSRAAALEQARRKILEQATKTFMKSQPSSQTNLAGVVHQTLVRSEIIEEHIVKEEARPTEMRAREYAITLRARAIPSHVERTGHMQLSATLNKTSFKDGEEMLITASTNKDSYIHIFNVGQADEVTALLPNRFTQHNFVTALHGLSFPDDVLRDRGVRLKVFLPPGANTSHDTIKLIATTRNVDLIKGKIREGVYQQYSSADTTVITELLTELALLDPSEWTEITVPYEVRK